MGRLKALWARLQRTGAWRAWHRYGQVRGNVLAGGVTYFSFLSLFPLLALAFAIFGVVLQDRPGDLERIRQSIDEALPGFVDDGSGNGLIPIELPGGGTLATIGVVGVLGLLFGGLGWLGALRDGIRGVFGVEGSPGNPVLTKLRDLGVLVLLGVAVVASATVSGLAGAAASWVAGLVGIEQDWVVTAVGIAVQAVLNTAVVALLFRVLSGVPLSWHGLRQGSLAGGVVLTVIQLCASLLIGSTMNNPVFASIALVVGLLVFLNFIARAILISAAWAANDLDASAETGATRLGRTASLAAQALPRDTYEERVKAGVPTFGARAGDRSTLAAGAVLGAVGAFATGAALRGIRAVFRRH